MEQQKYNLSLKNTVTEKLQFISNFFLPLCSITVQTHLQKLDCWLFLQAGDDKEEDILHTFRICLFELLP